MVEHNLLSHSRFTREKLACVLRMIIMTRVSLLSKLFMFGGVSLLKVMCAISKVFLCLCDL